MTRTAQTLMIALAAVLTLPAQAGDAVAGKQKAAACVACHGNEGFGGIFYTLQLGGRDADKLTVKTMKYKTGKILHPVMNLATALYSEKDIEDVSAYYKSLGKPAVTSPFFKIQGDDEVKVAVPAAAPAAPAATYGSADKVASKY